MDLLFLAQTFLVGSVPYPNHVRVLLEDAINSYYYIQFLIFYWQELRLRGTRGFKIKLLASTRETWIKYNLSSLKGHSTKVQGGGGGRRACLLELIVIFTLHVIFLQFTYKSSVNNFLYLYGCTSHNGSADTVIVSFSLSSCSFKACEGHFWCLANNVCSIGIFCVKCFLFVLVWIEWFCYCPLIVKMLHNLTGYCMHVLGCLYHSLGFGNMYNWLKTGKIKHLDDISPCSLLSSFTK
jgi:hypothetical protein